MITLAISGNCFPCHYAEKYLSSSNRPARYLNCQSIVHYFFSRDIETRYNLKRLLTILVGL